MAIQIRSKLRKLQPSRERVAAAGLEIELPKFELPGEANNQMAEFANGAICASNGFSLYPLDLRLRRIQKIFVNLSPEGLLTKKDGKPKSRILGREPKRDQQLRQQRTTVNSLAAWKLGPSTGKTKHK